MPSMPLICSSRGRVTVSATTSLLAPGKLAWTCTCGGSTGGKWAVGSAVMDNAPTITMMMAMTDAKIGRSMKKSLSIDRSTFYASSIGKSR